MNKSLIWITAGIAAVGFAVPAFAARGDSPEHIAPAQVTVATAAPTPTLAVAASNAVNPTAATVAPTVAPIVASTDDNIAHDATDDNIAHDATDDNGVDATDDDATENSVEDISGPCDEAEHATDPTCTGVAASANNDNSAHDANDDNSAHGGGSDDSGHNGGNETDG
jgi:hypothetical protein